MTELKLDPEKATASAAMAAEIGMAIEPALSRARFAGEEAG